MLGQHMEAELREQPDALLRNGTRYFSEARSMLAGRRFEMVLLAARGSSDHAALYARYLIEIHLGIPVSLAAPSVITRYGRRIRYPRCLAIGISQSGAAPDVAEVISAMRADRHCTLAITNTESSRLAKEAEHTLLLNVGEERALAATKTYTASLLALHELTRALGGDLPESEGALPDEKWLQATRDAAEEGLGPVLRAGILFSLARGYSFASAHETALKMMECALLPCKSYSIADFEHGPKALAAHGSTSIVFDEPPDFLTQQGSLVVQAPRPAVPAPLAPIHDAFFGQWLALLAARARGLNADQVEHLQKVTQTL